MMSSPCASNHASATWPGVALYFLPIALTVSTSSKILGKFSFENLCAVLTYGRFSLLIINILPRNSAPEVAWLKVIG